MNVARAVVCLLPVVALGACGGRVGGDRIEGDVAPSPSASPSSSASEGGAIGAALPPPEDPALQDTSICKPGDAPVALADAVANVVVLHDGYVYWGSRDGVHRVPKSGGAAVSLGGAKNSFGASVASAGVLFGESDLNGRLLLWAGGTWTSLLSLEAGEYGIAVGGDFVYYANPGEVGRVSISSGVAQTLTHAHDPTHVQVDDLFAYYTTWDGTLSRVALGGGSPRVLAKIEYPYALALDAETVYVTTPTSLMKVPKGGGTPILVAKGANINDVVVDGDDLYWVEMDGNAVWRMPKSGGAPDLIGEYRWPYALAVDDTCVYWVSSYIHGAVMRAPK